MHSVSIRYSSQLYPYSGTQSKSERGLVGLGLTLKYLSFTDNLLKRTGHIILLTYKRPRRAIHHEPKAKNQNNMMNSTHDHTLMPNDLSDSEASFFTSLCFYIAGQCG